VGIRGKGVARCAGGEPLRCSLIYDRSDFRLDIGNWYHFIKPIRCIKNLLLLSSLEGRANSYFEECFHTIGQGALGMGL
jgi:hypothetical protein